MGHLNDLNQVRLFLCWNGKVLIGAVCVSSYRDDMEGMLNRNPPHQPTCVPNIFH